MMRVEVDACDSVCVACAWRWKCGKCLMLCLQSLQAHALAHEEPAKMQIADSLWYIVAFVTR